MGVTEVTRAQFGAFVRETGYETEAEKKGSAWVFDGNDMWKDEKGASWLKPGAMKQEEDHPVVCVSWNDAKAFCEWLSR
jgi:formylglycine-generating enzyme required for sulfatase activity